MAQLILLPGKERSAFKLHHPWLFAGAVGRLEGRARPGDTVEVLADNLRPLGRSQIRARLWTFDCAESVDDAFFKRRIAAAVARRQALPELRGQQGLRLIHAESDGLPGVIADQYWDTVVVQLTSAGADKWRSAIVAGLVKATGCTRIYERSDSDVRGLEGLEMATGWLHGTAPDSPAIIEENGVRLTVDIVGGHKTGFYLDQRDNRALLGQLAAGRRGYFRSNSSGPALEQARISLALNPQLPSDRAEWREADVFLALRDFRKQGRLFDLIVLDPPKFAPSAAHDECAARAYKDINVLGFRLLRPGGLLMTYSCSDGIGLELFQKIVAGAALDAGREARIVHRLTGSADHPVALNFPEGEYLKGLLVQVD